MKVFSKSLEFEWDKGNSGKNLSRHNVTDGECEEIFFDPKKKILKDSLHSGEEERHILLGVTKIGRELFAVFTIRKGRVRVISVRDLNKKEYELFI